MREPARNASPMAPLYFSVVVPTFNRAAMLVRVLDALGHQGNAPPFEVIVVDDGSSDDTMQRLQYRAEAPRNYEFRFVRQANAGPGRARNHGARLATGRYVVFIGDDTVPETDFLAEHARVHRDAGDDRYVACLGYTGWPPGEPVTSFMHYINDYGLQFGYKLIRHGATVPFNFFYTSNISLDRELLLDHSFDETFPAAAWEDIELAYRLDAAGLKIRYNRRAVTRHHHPMTVDSFVRRQYTVGRSGAIFFHKHPELGHFLGVFELRDRGLRSDTTLRRLLALAHLGERFRLLPARVVYSRLMREHYLRGLADGLREAGTPVPAA